MRRNLKRLVILHKLRITLRFLSTLFELSFLSLLIIMMRMLQLFQISLVKCLSLIMMMCPTLKMKKIIMLLMIGFLKTTFLISRSDFSCLVFWFVDYLFC